MNLHPYRFTAALISCVPGGKLKRSMLSWLSDTGCFDVDNKLELSTIQGNRHRWFPIATPTCSSGAKRSSSRSGGYAMPTGVPTGRASSGRFSIMLSKSRRRTVQLGSSIRLLVSYGSLAMS